MRRHPAILATLAAATATAATIGFTAAGASAGTGHANTVLPQHVFAPYFETYDTSTGLAALSRQWHAAVDAGHGREDISAARLALGRPDAD